MTYSILARDAVTGERGVAVTTASIAVGGLCPFYSLAGDIFVSQAFARPESGLALARLSLGGSGFRECMEALRADDPHFERRQLAMLRTDGDPDVRTGAACRPHAGHLRRPGVVVFGNFLAGPEVLEGMVDAFAAAEGESLAERLLRALEGGRDAGGQADGTGIPHRERSAFLRVFGRWGEQALSAVDLRVDLHAHAVEELRRLYGICAPVAAYNRLRADDPDNVPSLHAWERRNLSDHPPPPARR